MEMVRSPPKISTFQFLTSKIIVISFLSYHKLATPCLDEFLIQRFLALQLYCIEIPKNSKKLYEICSVLSKQSFIKRDKEIMLGEIIHCQKMGKCYIK